MATVRMVAREQFRSKMAEKGHLVRELLRKQLKDQNLDYEEKAEAVSKLNKRDRDESSCRGRNRCSVCGRPRGVYRKFKLCRLCLRKFFVAGFIPGMRKSSW